jgi:hypothetical protein
MKITLKLELSQMKEQQEITGTPNINSKSKKIAQRLINERSSPREHNNASLSAEVYNRLYEIGKQRMNQRNMNDSRHTPSKGTTSHSHLHVSSI